MEFLEPIEDHQRIQNKSDMENQPYTILVSLFFYFDHASRRGATTQRSIIDTYDLEFQHRFQLSEKQKRFMTS